MRDLQRDETEHRHTGLRLSIARDSLRPDQRWRRSAPEFSLWLPRKHPIWLCGTAGLRSESRNRFLDEPCLEFCTSHPMPMELDSESEPSSMGIRIWSPSDSYKLSTKRDSSTMPHMPRPWTNPLDGHSPEAACQSLTSELYSSVISGAAALLRLINAFMQLGLRNFKMYFISAYCTLSASSTVFLSSSISWLVIVPVFSCVCL
jgi:hypothetical protein